jgi:hypothetical protein
MYFQVMTRKAAAHLAAEQHGAITAAQAATAGLSSRQVRSLVDNGIWARRCREVFTVAGAPRTYESDVMVACLAGGPQAMACRGTVARLLEVGRPWFDDAPVEIALPRGASPRAVEAVGAEVHVYRTLRAEDRAQIGPIPATRAARLVVDLLGVAPVDALFSVADDVLHRRWATPAGIRARWAEASGRRRAVLDAVLLPWTRGPKPGSPKEMALSRVLQLHGLPRPVRHHEVRVPGRPARYLDLAYPHAKVAPEYDGRREHGARHWAADADREDELATIGWVRLPAGARDLSEPGATEYCRVVGAALEARTA